MSARSRFLALILSAGFLATALTANTTAPSVEGVWRVKTIAGQDVPDSTEVTLIFDAEGRVYGNSGCNRYTGSYASLGADLTFGDVAMTRMACPDVQMQTEQRFSEALSIIAQATISDDGALVLRDAQGQSVMRASLSGAKPD